MQANAAVETIGIKIDEHRCIPVNTEIIPSKPKRQASGTVRPWMQFLFGTERINQYGKPIDERRHMVSEHRTNSF